MAGLGEVGANGDSSAFTEQDVIDYLRDVVPLLLGGDAVTLFNALQESIDVIRG
jgi:hypothetical protein